MGNQKLKFARQQRGWSEVEAARRLGVSQSYLSMLETGERRLTPRLARKAMRVYDLPPTVLPVSRAPQTVRKLNAQALAEQLAALGYPGFAHLHSRAQVRNPAEVLLEALAQDDLEARLVEALPWLMLRYWGMNLNWLVEQAKLRDLQNRLGFVVSLARQLSARPSVPNEDRKRVLANLEALLARISHQK